MDNCTLTGNGGAAIIGRPLSGVAAGGPWQVDLRHSILWGNGVPDLASAQGCQLMGEAVADSVVQGGHASGTRVVDQDPLLVKGPAMDYYLSSRATGQAVDSVALDAGPALSQDLGLETFTTRLDSGLDLGPVDWGAHCAPSDEMDVYRGQAANALSPYAIVQYLPFDDGPFVLHDPELPLLFYDVWGVWNDIHVGKTEASGTVAITY